MVWCGTLSILSIRLQIQGHEFNNGPAQTIVDIDHEIISTAILLPSADSRIQAKACKRSTG